MEKLWLRAGLLLFVMINIGFISGCTNMVTVSDRIPDKEVLEARTKNTIDYFGTVSTLTVYDEFSNSEKAVKFESFWADLKLLMEEIDNDVSLSIDNSDIARFNNLEYGESTEISAHTANILKEAKEVHELSGGVYDPTVSPLVDLWAFTPRFNSNNYQPEYPYDRERVDGKIPLPDTKYIEGLTELVDLDGVSLSGNETAGYRITKNIKPVEIDGRLYEAKLDLGGIAKGYIVDKVLEMLDEEGYRYAYFSCGTSSIGFKHNGSLESDYFDLNIRKPREGENKESSFMSVTLNNTTLSSSGDYDNNYILDGILYSHIIDGTTGYPMNVTADSNQKGIANAILFADNAVKADALTTVLTLLDLEESLEFINQHLRQESIILVVFNDTYDYYEVVTNLDPVHFEIQDEAYQLAGKIDDNGNLIYTGSLLDSPQ